MQYSDLVQEIAETQLSDIQRQIFKLLESHPEGLTRHQLVQHLYGYTPVNINNDGNDRRIRKAIELMRNRLIPIVSTSKAAGYKLDISRETIRRMLDELQSRAQKIRNTMLAVSKFYDIPVFIEPAVYVQQEML